jgi:hypothetical protein
LSRWLRDASRLANVSKKKSKSKAKRPSSAIVVGGARIAVSRGVDAALLREVVAADGEHAASRVVPDLLPRDAG